MTTTPEAIARITLKAQAPSWAIALYILNLGDMLFTRFFLTRGFEEGNPAMAFLWNWHPDAFMAFKIFVVGGLLWVYYQLMRSPWHLGVLKGLTVVYGLLICYHVTGLLYFFV